MSLHKDAVRSVCHSGPFGLRWCCALRQQEVRCGDDVGRGSVDAGQGDRADQGHAVGLEDVDPGVVAEVDDVRTGFDGCTGDLYIADVGQDKWEEVNIEKAGEGNKNYGWNTMEATHCHKPASGCTETGITKPLVEYDHNAGKSITGGTVYRGSALPAVRGTYFYADYQSNTIWSLVYDRDEGTASKPVSLKQDINNVTSIVTIRNGADGEVYFVSLMSGIYKHEGS